MRQYGLTVLCILLFAACKFGENTDDASSTTTVPTVTAPQFNADNAYAHVQKQLSFGPRVPGTQAQKQCAQWMTEELNKTCDTVYVQSITVQQPISNKAYPCINVIGSINPQAQSRILLLCHWDSRGMADMDSNKSNHNKPIMAADDGASGVAVLLEMARAISTQKLGIGVDILMADVEDMGRGEWEKAGVESTFCLGTRHWARNPHLPNYKANYAICFDMVGAKGAEFRLEQYSKRYAADFQRKIWQTASNLGYSNYFIFEDGGAITDDHLEIINYAKIPSVDIINIPAASATGFAPHWHTMQDDMAVIDKSTLRAVGHTVLQVLYEY